MASIMIAIALFCQTQPDYYQNYDSRRAVRDQHACIKDLTFCVRKNTKRLSGEEDYTDAYAKCVDKY